MQITPDPSLAHKIYYYDGKIVLEFINSALELLRFSFSCKIMVYIYIYIYIYIDR